MQYKYCKQSIKSKDGGCKIKKEANVCDYYMNHRGIGQLGSISDAIKNFRK